MANDNPANRIEEVSDENAPGNDQSLEENDESPEQMKNNKKILLQAVEPERRNEQLNLKTNPNTGRPRRNAPRQPMNIGTTKGQSYSEKRSCNLMTQGMKPDIEYEER